MTEPLLTHDGDLVAGTVRKRPNRFVLVVEFPSVTHPQQVFLGDPGALEVLGPGTTVLCSPVDDPARKTGYDAIAAEAGDVYVSLRAALANDLFERILHRDALPEFVTYTSITREPQLPDGGRADFYLETAGHRPDKYVEVKSCTHADEGVVKFPDRPTERGRRHLGELEALVGAGYDSHVVFVVQRPDATRFEPYRSVDPEFADLLERVHENGVGVHALVTEFDPPHYWLRSPSLPIDLGD